MRRIALITGSVLALGVAALGSAAASAGGMGAPAEAAVGQAEESEADKAASRRVCRMITPTGTRMPIRSCRTQAQWDAETLQSQRGAEAQSKNDDKVRPGAFTRAY